MREATWGMSTYNHIAFFIHGYNSTYSYFSYAMQKKPIPIFKWWIEVILCVFQPIMHSSSCTKQHVIQDVHWPTSQHYPIIIIQTSNKLIPVHADVHTRKRDNHEVQTEFVKHNGTINPPYEYTCQYQPQ